MPKRKASDGDSGSNKKASSGTGQSWKDLDGGAVLLFDGPGVQHAKTVIGFDIDSTLIETKSGKKFATSRSDWKWWDECVPGKLKELHEQGVKVVFVTNQAGIEKKPEKKAPLCGKFQDMVAELGIPIQVFVCTGQNQYRKPSIRMWELMEKHNNGIKFDKKTSVYVGDAAGRAAGWKAGKKKDFSCGDRMFGNNAGIGFKTPEEYFLNEDPAPFKWGTFDGKAYLDKVKETDLSDLPNTSGQEMVILVARPASGKSTLAKKYFVPAGYDWVNMDTMKTKAKCVKAAKAAVEAGRSVIIDNTNPGKATRQLYLDLAKKAKIPARCLMIEVDPEMSAHMNFYRVTQTNGEVRRIPAVAYNMFKKNYDEPSKAEGFKEIRKIPFTPMFASKADKELFCHRFLNE